MRRGAARAAAAALPLLRAPPGAAAPAALCDLSSCGPLNVSATGRALTYRDGTPFYYAAATPWHLLQDLDLDGCKAYIDARLAQGFTALQLNALGLGDNPNANGDKFGSWTALNEPYWAFTDSVLRYMEQRGMAAYIVPIWAANWADSASAADHKAFGQALGSRWRSFGNVLWVLGGDRGSPPVDKYKQLLAGVRAGGARQLATAHVVAGHSSSEILPDVLDFFSVQNRAGRSGDNQYTGYLVLSDFNAQFSGRHKPTLMAETWYEDSADGGVCNLHKKRGVALREAYWGNRICGSLGEGYGCWGQWYASRGGQTFSFCGGSETTAGVGHDLKLGGAADIATHMQRVLRTLQWWRLQPDGGAAVPQGGQSGLYAARITSSGGPAAVLVYTTHAQSFTLNAAQTLSASVTVRYYDPSGGDQSGSTAFPISETHLSGDTVTVPAHGWGGDGVIIMAPA